MRAFVILKNDRKAVHQATDRLPSQLPEFLVGTEIEIEVSKQSDSQPTMRGRALFDDDRKFDFIVRRAGLTERG